MSDIKEMAEKWSFIHNKADEIIQGLKSKGLSYNEMLDVIRSAKRKINQKQ